jgi:uncharacterized membrane protein
LTCQEKNFDMRTFVSIRVSQTRAVLWQMHGVDDNLGKSKKILTSMASRMGRNKCIMSVLIAILLIVIVVIIFLKLRNWSQSDLGFQQNNCMLHSFAAK